MAKPLTYLLGKLVVKLHYRKSLDIYRLCEIHEPELWARGQRKSKVPNSLRWAVWRRDNYTCHYCYGTEHQMTLDHIIPETYGGKADLENLVTACTSCNKRKSSTTYNEFVNSEWLKKKQRQHISTMAKRKRVTMREKTSQGTSK